MSATRLDSVLHYVRRVLGNQAEQGSDSDLLQRFVRHRDDTAFELLMWRHAAMVLRVCQSVLRDSHAAEDAFQATFLALARKAASISRRESLAAWLYQVAYRVAVRARLNAVERRAVESRRHESRPRPEARGPGEVAAERDLVPLVHEELNRLAAKYRTPLVLCYLEGKTHAEAARQLGWAKGTVSGRLARGREMLKKRLVRRGVLFPASVLAVALAASKTSAVPPALVAATVQASAAFAAGNVAAAGVSVGVIHLTHGVLQAMCLSKMKATAAAVFAFLLIFVGAGALLRVGFVEVSAQAPARYDPARYSQRPAATPPMPGDPFAGPTIPVEDGPDDPLGGTGLPPGLAPPGSPARPGSGGGQPGTFPGGKGGFAQPANDTLSEQKRRIDSINNLKQIALAIHNYHDSFGHLPADITDEDGRPLLSWRVAILPYIEQGRLYNQFKLDERWDSPNNRKLVGRMPQLYGFPGGDDSSPPGAAETHYQGFAGKGTAFEPGSSLQMTDFTDGTSNTILIVEAANAVPWTKPQDLPYSAKKPIPALATFPEVIHAAFVDGSVHNLRKDFDDKEMRKAIVRDDGEVIDFDKLALPISRPGAPIGTPGMPGMGGPMGPGPPGGPGRPGMGPNVPSSPKLDKLRDDNAKLQGMLLQTKEEMQSLRQEMEQLKQQSAQKRQEQAEADRLLAEREMLKQQIEQAAAELKAMRDELQRLKRGQDKE